MVAGSDLVVRDVGKFFWYTHNGLFKVNLEMAIFSFDLENQFVNLRFETRI